jgi:4-carboxymuconolactone decarboxylase
MTRIPFPDLDKASPEVQVMLSRLPGRVGIFEMMAHAETVLKPLMKLGGTFLGKLELDPLMRELVILHAVNIEGGEYEWVQHVPVVLALGGTQAQVDALRAGDDQAACFSDAQKAALRLTREVVANVRASEATLEAARQYLSNREIVELILVAGFYIMLARLTETLDIPNDPPIGDKLVGEIEARVSAKK